MYRELIDDASAWTGADLAGNPAGDRADDGGADGAGTIDGSWRYEIDDAGRDELHQALAAVSERGLDLCEIGRADFALDGLGDVMASIGTQLRSGRGFALLRGVDVERYSLDDLEKIYWGLCAHLGTGITQNSDASLIHYVTDGALRPNQGRRGVGRPGRSSLHVDLTDCASLLCVRQAPDNPPSWVASSTQIHNELLVKHPEALEALYQGFEWDRLDEQGEEEGPTTGYRVPVFSERDGHVSCRYNRFWMSKAITRSRDRLPDETWELFNLFDSVADDIRLEVDFQPGDVQFINNYVVLHGRDAHEEVPDEAAKRLLMRIWVDFDEARPMSDEAVVRYGIVRHGRLGWTADQFRQGLHNSQHARSADGRPLVGATVGGDSGGRRG